MREKRFLEDKLKTITFILLFIFSLVSVMQIEQVKSTGVQQIGIYGAFGEEANKTSNTGDYKWDAFPTYAPSNNPPDNFNFVILTAEYGVTGQGANFNNYLRAIRSQNRIPFYRLFWGYNYNDINGAKNKIQSLMVGVDTSLLGGVVFSDDVRWTNPAVVNCMNTLYSWFKSKYPNVLVYQLWSPLETEGPYNGKPGFLSSWKADGWIWYSYWANYYQTKAFIQSCKTTQPGKPIIMILDYSVPQKKGFFDPYYYTPQQVQVAKEQNCSICLFAYSPTDKREGWWSGVPLAKARYKAGAALITNG